MKNDKGKTDIKDLRIETIEPRHEVITKNLDIDISKPEEVELKNFLIEDALENQTMEISLTYLWFYNPENKLIGYITLLSDAIRIHNTRLGKIFSDHGVPYKTLPALKIGRMCVNAEYQRKGIGTYMILFAMSRLIEINECAGCRFLVVDAKKNAIHFYKKLGFKVLKEKKKGTLPMFIDMVKIIRFLKENKYKLGVERTKKL